MASGAENHATGINVKSFEAMDASKEVQAYIDILDVFDALPGIQDLKKAAIERCRIREGMSILDAGCGTGLETTRLARLVGSSGKVMGLDASRNLLAEASRRVEGSQLPIEYREGDVHQLPFPADHFDGARAERLFLYLADPRQALAELVRVTKSGGFVYLIEPDFETQTINLNERRTVLLLVTLLTGVVVAGGIALAETFACTTNPCKGTENADLMTGTDPDPSSNVTGNDTIDGLGGEDRISALGGNDRVIGGAGNDTMDGGTGRDTYRFADSFGADSIPADTSGLDTLDFSQISTPTSATNPYYNGFTIDLVGPDPPCEATSAHCLALGGEFIERVVGTPFGDRLTGNSLNNDIRGGEGWDWLNGGAGNDRLEGGGGDVPTSDPDYHANHDFYTLTTDWERTP